MDNNPRIAPLSTMSDLLEEATVNPLEVAMERAQALLAEKERVREALEAEAQEVAQVIDISGCCAAVGDGRTRGACALGPPPLWIPAPPAAH